MPSTGAEPIRRIAVFRALVLGDLLCATPALRALKTGWPGSEVTLIGLPWARELARRLTSIDRFVEFPGHPDLPEIEPDTAKWPGFVDYMRNQRHDLLVQLHGSGGIVNPMLAGFGARLTAGFFDPDDTATQVGDMALHTPWPTRGTEIDRLLRLTDHLGLARPPTDLEFPVRAADWRNLQSKVPELEGVSDTASGTGAFEPFACLHPGAQLASRRWPPERFAAVADGLRRRGLRVILTGSPAEAALTAAVRKAMTGPALDLTGRTSLFELGALLQRAALLVCNDTGISHVAAAVGTPSVVVSSGGDVARWAPLDRARHRVVWRDRPCRPCAHTVCPMADPCATGVDAAEVGAAAADMLAAWPPARVAPHLPRRATPSRARP